MSSDNNNKIPIEIITNPVRLDKGTQLSNDRVILGYFVMDYKVDEDITLTIYVKRDKEMSFEELLIRDIKKEDGRIFEKLPLTPGSVIDYYVKLKGDFKEFIITSMKMLIKPAIVGKYGGDV